MPDQAVAGRATDFWTELFELSFREGCERALLESLLGALARALGAGSAALYVAGERGLRRELACGEPRFPPTLEADAEGVRIPGGLVAHDGGGEARAAPDLLAALATALRSFELSRRLKRQRFEVNYRGVELEALYDVGLAITSTLNLDELVEEILLRAVSLLDARRGALYLARDGALVLERTFGGGARERLDLDEDAVRELAADGAAGEAVGAELLPGARHLLAVPIEIEGRARGLLAVADKERRQGVGPFGAADRRTLSLFANQAAIALENAYLHRQALEKERLEREAELAAEIQRRLLPATLTGSEHFDLTGWNRPARQVGGDYYNVFGLGGSHLVAAVADVTGKGMPAALLVSTLHSALHLLVAGKRLEPDLYDRLNRHVFESSAANTFITLLLAEIEADSGRVAYLNAGHNPALLVGAGGDIRELASGGMPLGLFAGAACSMGECEMGAGDVLCLFSDGITECLDPGDREFGGERLAELLRRHRGEDLEAVVAAVDAALAAFARGAPQGDDQTLILLRRR